jgi:hypothetical protein
MNSLDTLILNAKHNYTRDEVKRIIADRWYIANPDPTDEISDAFVKNVMNATIGYVVYIGPHGTKYTLLDNRPTLEEFKAKLQAPPMRAKLGLSKGYKARALSQKAHAALVRRTAEYAEVVV